MVPAAILLGLEGRLTEKLIKVVRERGEAVELGTIPFRLRDVDLLLLIGNIITGLIGVVILITIGVKRTVLILLQRILLVVSSEVVIQKMLRRV